MPPQFQRSSRLSHALSFMPLEQESKVMWSGCRTGTGIDGYGNNSEHIQEPFKKIMNGVFSFRNPEYERLCYFQLQSLQNLIVIHITTSRRFGTIARFDYNVKTSDYIADSGNISCHTSHEVSGLPPPFANCSRKTQRCVVECQYLF